MTIHPSTLFTILNGWGDACSSIFSKEEEDAARQGHNLCLATINQISQISVLKTQFLKIEKTVGHIYVPDTIKFLALCVPCLYPGLRHLVDESLRPSLRKLHDHVGSLCQLASVVTNVALFCLGHYAYAGMSLGVITFGYLERSHYLPLKVKKVYSQMSPWIHSVGLIFSSQRILQAFGSVSLYGLITKWYFSTPLIPYERIGHQTRLTYNQFNQILNGNAHFSVIREHVTIIPFPFVKEINFTPLIELCDSFDWGDDATTIALEDKLVSDPRWEASQEYQLTLGKSAEEAKLIKIDYAKRELKILISKIDLECIETGEPLDYGIIKNYLAYIAQHLPQAPKDLQLRILLQLAIEGGQYCGPGVYYQLETAATSVLIEGTPENSIENRAERPRLPLKQRILIILQQERLRVVSAFHTLVDKINSFFIFLYGGLTDMHSIKLTTDCLASNFGLPGQGTQKDDTTCFQRLYFQYVLTGIKSENLWTGGTFEKEKCEGYTQKRILDAVKVHIGVSLIPKFDIIQWALNWIEKVSSGQEKEDFIEKLQDGTFEKTNSEFRDELILAMLVDMGILQL